MEARCGACVMGVMCRCEKECSCVMPFLIARPSSAIHSTVFAFSVSCKQGEQFGWHSQDSGAKQTVQNQRSPFLCKSMKSGENTS